MQKNLDNYDDNYYIFLVIVRRVANAADNFTTLHKMYLTANWKKESPPMYWTDWHGALWDVNTPMTDIHRDVSSTKFTTSVTFQIKYYC